MSKRNDKTQAYVRIQRSISLENAVLHGSLQAVADVLAGGGPFGFTGRAMACAILQGGPEKVKLLYEAGIRLARTAPLAEQEIFGHIDHELCLVDGLAIPRTVSTEEWVESLRFLYARADRGICWGRVYYYALMLHQTELFEVFQQEPPQTCWKEGNRLWAGRWVHHPDPMGLAQRLTDCARQEKLPVTARMMACCPEAFLRDGVWERCEISRISRTGVLKDLVKCRRMEALRFALRLGWMQPAKADELLALAAGDGEITALLLAEKRRAGNSETEKRRRIRREQQAQPRRETENQRLRRWWTTRKQPDGTLMLRKYKGPQGNVTVPQTIGRFPVTALKNGLFQELTLAQVALPEGLQSLGKSAFAGTALISVQLPGQAAEIPAGCFRNCEGLRTITWPEGLKHIGAEAFSGCAALEEILLPAGLETLETRAFAGCIALRRTTLPEGLAEIPTACFEECAALAAVQFPSGLAAIGSRAFAGCAVCDIPRWPETLTSIGEGAFRGAGVRRAKIPAGVRLLSAEAFAECGQLQTVCLADVAEIGFRAFASCPALTSVTLPETLKTIGPMAFSDCTGLREIRIPASVTHIADDAFEGCAALTIHAPEGSIAAGFAKHEGFRRR